jgi:hypothetical protein
MVDSLTNDERGKKNSVASVWEQTILTERQPLVGKVGASFADREVLPSQRGRLPMAIISIFYAGAATFSFK